MAVAAALRAIYLPWLDEGAAALQELVRNGKVKFSQPEPIDPDVTTVLFVDGLRMDIAQQLVEMLRKDGFKAGTRLDLVRLSDSQQQPASRS